MDRIIGGCAKEGNLCLVCGRELPAPVGLAVRAYCSAECRANRRRVIGRSKRKPASLPCVVCGASISQNLGSGGRVKELCSQPCKTVWKRAREGKQQKPSTVPCLVCGSQIPQAVISRGRTVTLCSKECRLSRNRSRQKACLGKKQSCGRCGIEFFSRWEKLFCSRPCQHNGRGDIHGDSIPCEGCKKLFKKSRRRTKFCSRACAKPAAVFRCLNCEVEFKKKIYESGAYSCQSKYCSRDCAFKARRLKKKCAERPLEIANKLATWFLSWGDDCWPAIKKCQGCGLVRRWAKDAPRPPDCCQKCARQRQGRRCSSCEVTMPWSATRRVCDNCRDANLRESRRKSKSKYGRNHRQRTRSRGAPYTAIRNSSIYERDNWECQICCRPLEKVWKRVQRGDRPSPRARTVDHVIPLARGKDSPGHVWHNLIACCHECNSAKCDKDPTGWACPLPRSSDSFAIP